MSKTLKNHKTNTNTATVGYSMPLGRRRVVTPLTRDKPQPNNEFEHIKENINKCHRIG